MTNLTYNEKGKILVTTKRIYPSYSYGVGIKAFLRWLCACQTDAVWLNYISSVLSIYFQTGSQN